MYALAFAGGCGGGWGGWDERGAVSASGGLDGASLARDKAGAIPADLAPVLERLELDVENWLSTVERYGSLYHRVAGNVEKLREAAQRVGQRWFRRRGSGRLRRGVSRGVIAVETRFLRERARRLMGDPH